VPHSGDYFAEQDPNKHIWDPTSWYLAGPRWNPGTSAPCTSNSGFGGPYDAANQLLGPATAKVPICMWGGL